MQEGERGKGNRERKRVVGKATGDECVFMPGEGLSWQMRSAPTPYRTRRAVRTAKSDSVNSQVPCKPHFQVLPFSAHARM
jgi:hypothetical protein